MMNSAGAEHPAAAYVPASGSKGLAAADGGEDLVEAGASFAVFALFYAVFALFFALFYAEIWSKQAGVADASSGTL